jgi:hypothetical protein
MVGCSAGINNLYMRLPIWGFEDNKDYVEMAGSD